VKIGTVQIFPDLVLTTTDRGRRLMGTVEVETAESVNHLEAMAQWAHLGRAKAPFHLYVPAGSVDIARRLAAENGVNVAEIWSFHTIGDQTRFTMVHRAPGPTSAAPRRRTAPPRRTAPRRRGGDASRPAARPRRGLRRRRPHAPRAAPRRAPRPARRKAPPARPRPRQAHAEGKVVLPHLRFSRDKRGYEHTFVVHGEKRRGRSRARILYWFRTPPGVGSGGRRSMRTPSG
jgi:hypothetical protein